MMKKIFSPILNIFENNNDEFIYRMRNVDPAWYATIFGQSIPWAYSAEIKNKIYFSKR